MTIQLKGTVQALQGFERSGNFNDAAQALTAATEALITGSVVKIPDCGLKKGSRYRVRFGIDKTGAGTATSGYSVRIGAAASLTADEEVLLFTKPAGTAVADEGVVEIEVTFTAIAAAAEGSAVRGYMTMLHNLAATGHAQVPTPIVPAVDTTLAAILTGRGGQYLFLAITTGAADVSNVDFCEAELTVPVKQDVAGTVLE